LGGVELARALLAGFKRQRLGKLNGYLAEKIVHLVNTMNAAGAGEIGKVEAVIRTEAGDAEASRYRLARIWTILVRVTGKCRCCAVYVNHLSLQQDFVEILCEPHRPVIPESPFFSSLAFAIHRYIT